MNKSVQDIFDIVDDVIEVSFLQIVMITQWNCLQKLHNFTFLPTKRFRQSLTSLSSLPTKMNQSHLLTLKSYWLHEKNLMPAFCWLAQKKLYELPVLIEGNIFRSVYHSNLNRVCVMPLPVWAHVPLYGLPQLGKVNLLSKQLLQWSLGILAKFNSVACKNSCKILEEL